MNYTIAFKSTLLSLLIMLTISCSEEDPILADSRLFDLEAELIIGETGNLFVEVSRDVIVDRVILQNTSGGSLEIRNTAPNKFENEIDFVTSGFSESDEFILEILLENGEVFSSESTTVVNPVLTKSITPSVTDGGATLNLAMNVSGPNSYLNIEGRYAYKVTNDFAGSNERVVGGRVCGDLPRGDLCSIFNRPDDNFDIAILDCDGDGVTNAVECDRGTDPQNNLDRDIETSVVAICYISESINEFPITVATESIPNGNSKFNEFVQIPIDDLFKERLIIDFQIQEISKESFEFQTGGSDLSNVNNSSNPDLLVNGFFNVAKEESMQIILSAQELNEMGASVSTRICSNDSGNSDEDQQLCLNCEGFFDRRGKSVSYIRPEFWVE